MKRLVVITWGGFKQNFTKEELREMLADKEMYKDADNLPKWLFSAWLLHKSKGFPRTWKQTWAFIERILKYPGYVTINVRADYPKMHCIEFFEGHKECSLTTTK